MSKRILVLNGSPRKNGNTSALIDAFTGGAEQAGHMVSRFDLQQMAIRPCIGCVRGGRDKHSPCTQKDEMDQIYAAFAESDVLVLASPLYYWSFSAQLKIAIDRLFAVTEANGMKTPRKACAMLIAAEEDSDANFAPIRDYYRTMLAGLGWEDVGQVLAGGVIEVGDIQGKPVLDEARRLGGSL